MKSAFISGIVRDERLIEPVFLWSILTGLTNGIKSLGFRVWYDGRYGQQYATVLFGELRVLFSSAIIS